MNKLTGLKITIVSLVKSPANKHKFLMSKSEKNEGIDIPVVYEKGGKITMDIKKLVEVGLISKEEKEMLEKAATPEAGGKSELQEIADKINGMLGDEANTGKDAPKSEELVKQLKKLNEILVKKAEEKPAEEKSAEEKKADEEKNNEEIVKAKKEELVTLIKETNDTEVFKKAIAALRDGNDIDIAELKKSEKETKKETETISKSDFNKLNEKIDQVILKSNQIKGDEVKKEEKKDEGFGGAFV